MASPRHGSGQRSGILGAVALALFTLVGGALIFGFTSALAPAIERQGEAACRPLAPLVRSGLAPAWEVQDLQGAPVRLEDFRGKLVVLNFWATWCEPCIGEWPQIERLAERFADRDDVVVLAISIDKTREEIAPFLERMALSSSATRVLWDPSQTLHQAYGSEKIPDTFFIDRQGRLLHHYINVRDWGRPAAYRCVSTLADAR